jgi:hypothetical protein
LEECAVSVFRVEEYKKHFPLYLAYYSVVKMEAACSSKTLLTIYWTTQYHNLEDSNVLKR